MSTCTFKLNCKIIVSIFFKPYIILADGMLTCHEIMLAFQIILLTCQVYMYDNGDFSQNKHLDLTIYQIFM